jgi:uncharacterized protein
MSGERTEAIAFPSGDRVLFGIWHEPALPRFEDSVVLMMVGGPQNRVGSHRSYTQWARSLSAAGHRVLRFDYEGTGDSQGDYLGYGLAGPSIAAALEYCQQRLATLKHPLLFALCDGAAASLIFAGNNRDAVSGLLLLNPYTHSSQSRAKTMMRHYYLSRLRDLVFWRKMLRFQLDWKDVIASFRKTLRDLRPKSVKLTEVATASTPPTPNRPVNSVIADAIVYTGFDEELIPGKVAQALSQYQKPMVVLLSEPDLTAQDFRAFVSDMKALRPYFLQGLYSMHILPEADHTFSTMAWKNMAAKATLEGLQTLLHSARKGLP